MAQFVKGQSGNPNGKPPGVKSRKVVLWEQLSDYLLNSGAERFKKELIKLKGADYIDGYLKVMEFFKPKLSRSQIKVDGDINAPVSVIKLVEVKKPDGNTTQA